jgi:hypothetical protein
MFPVGFMIAAVASVSTVTRLPCNNQHKPTASYLDNLLIGRMWLVGDGV